MTLTFSINYRTPWGQSICVVSDNPLLGWTDKTPLELSCQGTDYWTATVPVTDFAGVLTYRYAIRLENGGLLYESGQERHITLHSSDKQLVLHDFWQVNDYEKSFYSTAFLKSLFRRPEHKNRPYTPKGNLRFSIDLPQILPTQGVAVMGNIPELGSWSESGKLLMSDTGFPI